ncbi:MAG: UbiA family prenyltransferase [Bacteroidetes bacterium]|nr:UbiA family prenyltransferase [Bacteroidota bacterium]
MKTLFAFFRLVRISNLLMIALSLSLFYYLILIPVHQDKLHSTLVPFTTFEFVLFILSVVFIAAAGNIINDYFDFELDREFKPERPLAQGLFSLDTTMYLHMGFALSGIALGYYLGWLVGYFSVGYIYIICSLLLYIYSSYLKKIPLVGNVAISALTGFVFVLLLIFEANFLRVIFLKKANMRSIS